MNKKLLKNKYVFVDMDGTIAEFLFDGKVDYGLREAKPGVFLRSRPIKSVINTLRKSKAAELYICGAVDSYEYIKEKYQWLKEHCSNLNFSEFYWFIPDDKWDVFVNNFKEGKVEGTSMILTKYGRITKGEKTQMWSYLNNKIIKDTVFIDDHHPYLKETLRQGVQAYHPSVFVK